MGTRETALDTLIPEARFVLGLPQPHLGAWRGGAGTRAETQPGGRPFPLTGALPQPGQAEGQRQVLLTRPAPCFRSSSAAGQRCGVGTS